jgi:hypothetical protein
MNAAFIFLNRAERFEIYVMNGFKRLVHNAFIVGKEV